MKDYYKLIPDKTRLLTGNFTKGRGGVKPNMIVRHHFAGIGNTDWLWQVWQGRAASAHYGVESGTGVVGQLVYDDDTAWHAANAAINARSYGLEHGNITGRVHGDDNHPDSWKIHEDTIKGGARVAAALCLKDGMGVPEWGKNITDHRNHYGTSCPLKLARGGIYDRPWFDEATWFYDQLAKGLVNPDGSPKFTFAPPTIGEDDMTPEDRALLKENNQLLKAVMVQLGQPGGHPQGGDRTLYDVASATAAKLGVPGTYDKLNPEDGDKDA